MDTRVIVIEGVDGVGKTAQVALLSEALKHQGKNVICCKLPRESQAATHIFNYVARHSLPVWIEIVLFLLADRFYYNQVVKPLLDRKDGVVLVFDRWFPSFICHFSALGVCTPRMLNFFWNLCVPLKSSCRVVVIDLPTTTILERLAQKSEMSKFDNISCDEIDRRSESYRTSAKVYDWIIIDGNGSTEDVHRRVLDVCNQ